MNWITQFLTWLRLLFAGWINPPYKTIVVQALLPEKLKRKTIYIVEEDGFEEQAAMLCPRCRNHVLHMNLLPDERPCWTITCHDDGTASLHPSVWRKKECGVHFWFRRGRVRWT
ncbi:DUF6527 family protein [Rhizobium sp. P38BS-XIX]|uniref:DUF6527 family protein n=1 Tax=Rhizobium sp. P38BS-XIX TaxID=2726740 RepID=UPI002484C59D|nr:DUF6527 family protein [Rhizobium sp. P38BS-XIX]